MSQKLIECLGCSSQKVALFEKSNQYTLYKCHICQLVFLFPPPKRTSLESLNEKFYGNSNNEDKIHVSDKISLKRAEFFIRRIIKYKRNGNILDIGSGFGYNLATAQEYGFKGQGIELSEGAATYAKAKFKLSIQNKDFNTLKLRNNIFDVVTMYDVLEHMENPNLTLNKIYKILKKNGLFVIQCPNIGSVMAKITKKRWVWLLLPYHLIHFTPESLEKLLIRYKFRVLEINTRDEWSEFIENILWILKVHRAGKLRFLFYPLYYILWVFYPMSLVWSQLGKGGIINVYATKT